MKTHALRAALLAAVTAGALATPQAADAGYRQYYTSWSYHPQRSYHYRTYFYRPVVSTPTYHHHYVVYRPATPRYVYYYNPRRQVYWGRYDLEGEKGKEYSLLAEKDRKKDLEDIPESAFPPPAEMPQIPDAEDGAKLLPPPTDKPVEAEQAEDLP